MSGTLQFEATIFTWDRLCEHYGQYLEAQHVYKVTAEPLTKRDAIFRLFHALRDLYADYLGPRDRYHCKQLLKWRYGPHRDAGEVVYNPETGATEFRWDQHFVPPKKLGLFYTFRDEGVVTYLVSTTVWTHKELLSACQAIEEELQANGVSTTDAHGTD